MTRRWCVVWSLTALLLGSQMSRAADVPPAAKLVPSNAVLVLEVSQPKAVLDLVLSKRMIDFVIAQPAFRLIDSRPDYQGALQIVKFVEFRLGTDWKTALHKLLEGGVTIAVLPDNGLVAIVDSQDAELLKNLHEVLVQGTRDDAQKKGNPDPIKSREIKGVTAWTFDGKSEHVLLDSRFVLASSSAVLEKVLELRDAKDVPTLADQPRYQAAKKASAKQAAMLFADLTVLKHVPQVEQAIQTSASNPMAALLTAGFTDIAKTSTWGVLCLNVQGETLTLEAVLDGKPTETAQFMTPAEGKGAPELIPVPRQIGNISLYRDLHAFYTAKDKLFPERTSGLILFENMMGIMFSGRDLTEEIFGEIEPDMQIVVAAQQYGPKFGTPRVQIPGFAIIFRMKNPDEFTPVAEQAWQKAIGLTNIGRGQRAEPGMTIDRDFHEGIKFFVATNSLGKDEDKTNLSSRFNFEPAIARVGKYLIYSSTVGLTKDIITALKPVCDAEPKALANTHSFVAVDGVALSAVLEADRASMVSQNMVEKGHTQAQAEGETDFAITLVKRLGHATLIGDKQGDITRFRLEVKLNLP